MNVILKNPFIYRPVLTDNLHIPGRLIKDINAYIIRSKPDILIHILLNAYEIGCIKTIPGSKFRCVIDYCVSVKSVDPGEGGEPHVAMPILLDVEDGRLREALLDAKVFEACREGAFAQGSRDFGVGEALS